VRSQKIDDVAGAFIEGTPIDLALARGVLEALRRHKQAGVPVVEWRDGRAVLVPPEEIDLRPLEREIASLARQRNGDKSRKH
jgi:hypothetical protein